MTGRGRSGPSHPWHSVAHRVWPVVLVAVGTVGTLTGCAPVVCPAIGWFNTATVELTGQLGDVADVQLCADDVCAASVSSSDLTQEQPGQYVGFSVSQTDDDTWTVTFDMQSPEEVTVRALSAAGEVLAETTTELDWKRVGGSDSCGGPGEAGPVPLNIG